ncbi:FMR1-interacting protein NUFIP1 [Siphateles boraxobius]|uniref:FMR1-interacting protein NUFIP1 n=1 Tax=Siphateles boraxobius TaxID=180520 RepID=UPI004063E0B6
MTAEQERYPPPSFSGASEASVSPGDPWTGRRFEASRDWSWSWAQPEPAGPWSSSPGQWYQQPRGRGQQQYGGHHHQRGVWRGSGQHQRGKKKQQREPEFSHFCDTCDRAFKTQGKYDEHISQHVKCSVEDCRFNAHEKLVKIHWRNNHAPGAKRIRLDSVEDIAKWREERRRHYPTLRNLEKKQKLVEVKEQRGDVLETPQFGRMRSRGGSSQKRPTQERDPLAVLADSEPESDKDEPQTGLTVAPRCVTSALGSLMSSYGDAMTSSDSDGEPDDAAVLRATLAVQENKTLLADDALPVQRNTEKHTDRPQQSHHAPQQSHHAPQQSHHAPQQSHHAPQQSHHAPAGRGRGRGRGRGKGRGRGRGNPAELQQHRATLLEMLLAPDIRHERNVVLQCVRYVVRNGFFGLAGKNHHEIEVCVEDNRDDASDDVTRDGGFWDPQKRSETLGCADESPVRASVFQQLFARGLVCDDPEQT